MNMAKRVLLVLAILMMTQLSIAATVSKSTLGIPMYIPNTLRTITCLAENPYQPSLPVICGQFSLYYYNVLHVIHPERVENHGLTLVAGKYGIPGYNEGIADEARFTDIQEVVHLNQSVLLVSDHQNHCLRIIIGSLTAHYAGKCLESGFKDGNFQTARFSSPAGFVKVRQYLYLSDMHNHAIRIIDLEEQYITTLLEGPHRNSIFSPLYIACGPSCEFLYVSMLYGVAKVNRETKRTTLISGALNQYGESVGTLSSTRFMWPEKLTLISPNELIVADRNSQRLVLLNLETDESEGIPMSHSTFAFPWPVLKLDDILLVGTNQTGLFICNIGTSMPIAPIHKNV